MGHCASGVQERSTRQATHPARLAISGEEGRQQLFGSADLPGGRFWDFDGLLIDARVVVRPVLARILCVMNVSLLPTLRLQSSSPGDRVLHRRPKFDL